MRTLKSDSVVYRENKVNANRIYKNHDNKVYTQDGNGNDLCMLNDESQKEYMKSWAICTEIENYWIKEKDIKGTSGYNRKPASEIVERYLMKISRK